MSRDDADGKVVGFNSASEVMTYQAASKFKPMTEDEKRQMLDRLGAHCEGMDGEAWDENVIRAVEDFHRNKLASVTAPEHKPMMSDEVIDLVRECGLDWQRGFMPLFEDDPTNRFGVLVRAVEARFLQGTSWDSREQDVHPDDKAVDRFAARMKWKLANARAKGKSGWQDRSWTPDQISADLRQHVDKGDPTDVANYCMFLAARGEPIAPKPEPRTPNYANLVAQTIVRHEGNHFVVSTINRPSSAVLSYGAEFAETYVFPLDPTTNAWGKALYQFDAPAGSTVRHCWAVNELSKNGVINELS